MAKRLKLKFAIPSFQCCRSRNLSNFPGNPVVPAVYRLSPVNPKALDMGYPSLPSTPDEHRVQCDCKVSSNIISVGNGCCRFTVRKQHSPFNYSPDYTGHDVCCESTFCKMRRDKGNNVKARGRRSPTSVSSSISKLNDEEESESLISCLTSFSEEFYRETVQSPERASQIPEVETSRHRKKISDLKKVQRLKFPASQSRSISETGETTKTVMSMGSMTRCTVEGNVKESFAVVKKSKDPHEDFKKSMLEMIMEMEMFEAKELEQLLHCFLALNSRHYHRVIVQAFSQIWQELFGETASVDQISPNRL